MKGLNCYTCAIARLLNNKCNALPEEYLYYELGFLSVSCVGSGEAIYVDLYDIVKKVLENHGLKKEIIEINNLDSLYQNIRKYQSVLMKSDCRLMNYSERLKSAMTNQTNHFVCVEDALNKRIKIYDGFIPSQKQPYFYDWMDVDSKFISQAAFYNIVQTNRNEKICSWHTDEIIKYSLEMALCNNSIAFRQFATNILELMNLDDVTLQKKVFLEMSMTVSNSGVVASRGALHKYIINKKWDAFCGLDIELLQKKYTLLSRLLLKQYFKYSRDECIKIRKSILDIEKLEEKIFGVILYHL